MKTYLTSHIKYKWLDTPRIEADSWLEAESKCNKNNIVIGELIEEGEIEFKYNINLN